MDDHRPHDYSLAIGEILCRKAKGKTSKQIDVAKRWFQYLYKTNVTKEEIKLKPKGGRKNSKYLGYLRSKNKGIAD